jgi:hypothetical protein
MFKWERIIKLGGIQKGIEHSVNGQYNAVYIGKLLSISLLLNYI